MRMTDYTMSCGPIWRASEGGETALDLRGSQFTNIVVMELRVIPNG